MRQCVAEGTVPTVGAVVERARALHPERFADAMAVRSALGALELEGLVASTGGRLTVDASP
ncbi:MAG: hypothetical protein UHD09_05650 [Bifidobacterium sp.]|nr:hypothetical protein [Bifidobacterium sp.]